MSTPLSLAEAVLLGLVLSAPRGIQDAPQPAPAQPSASAVTPPSSTEAAAREILSAMAKAYAECSSYRDSGTVTTKFTGGGDQTNRLAFKTAFVRGGSFRFEYSDLDGQAAGKPYIVWTNFNVIRSWWHVRPGVARHFLLSMALAGATGVSGGSAHTIPRLLMPDKISGWVLTEVNEPELAGEETIDGRACRKLVAKHPSGSPLTMWIDKESHLVRQLFESHELKEKDLKWEETTTYTPEVGVTIDPAELKFNPPADPAESPEK